MQDGPEETEPPSTWDDIQQLALSFNGYDAAGSFDRAVVTELGRRQGVQWLWEEVRKYRDAR